MEADIIHNPRDLYSKQTFIRNAFACFNYHFFSLFSQGIGARKIIHSLSGQLCRKSVESFLVLVLMLLGMRDSSQVVSPV